MGYELPCIGASFCVETKVVCPNPQVLNKKLYNNLKRGNVKEFFKIIFGRYMYQVPASSYRICFI